MAETWSYKDFVRDALTRVKEASCEQLSEQLPSAPVVLDVRETDELAGGTIPGAVQLSRGLLEKHVGELVPNLGVRVFVCCSTGNRSALAADVLQRMGYTQVHNVAGGMARWQALGLPLDRAVGVEASHGTRSWDEVRRQFPIVDRSVQVLGAGTRKLVYLDHAASTHPPLAVLRTYREFMEHEYANIHRGVHLLSRKASERFDEAYTTVAEFVGGQLDDGCVTFLSNTTQAIDLASHVVADLPGKVMTTEMEHHSNDLPHRSRGPVLRARVNHRGELDLEHMESLLRRERVKLVAVTAGSNVTGLVPDLTAIAKLAHEHGALVLADAAQALARRPLTVESQDPAERLDFLAGAGHKAYAPFGSAFLYGPRRLLDAAPPYLAGGGTAATVNADAVEYLESPDRHQGGTPNIGGVVGLAASLSFLRSIGMDAIRAHERELIQRAIAGLRALGGVTIYGNPDDTSRLGVVSFNVDGVSDMLTAAVLSEEGGIAVRNGRFCAHVYVDRLLSEAHAGSDRPGGAVRASVGLYNNADDVDRFLEFVRRVREERWIGRYKVRGDTMNAEFAGRCADRWMEAAYDTEAADIDISGAASGYEFHVLQPTGSCRTYVIADPQTKEAAIVDPLREEVDTYLALLERENYTLKYTVDTHTHADHYSGSARLRDATGAQLLMHKAAKSECRDRALKGGDTIEIGAVSIEVIETLGHADDSISLLLPDRILTGDSLLIGGCGRTDLGSGDPEALYQSLQRLRNLPDTTIVFPGHDYEGRRASTIAIEKRRNPRLNDRSLEEFTAALRSNDMPVPERFDEIVATNRACRS